MSWDGCLQGTTNPEEHDMRVPSFPMIASFVLLAAPAFAQTSSMTGGQLSDSPTSSRLPPDTVVTLDTQQKLKQSIEQNGFKNVIVVPEAYVIHAQAPDGSKIVMEVSPDQMQAVIERTGSSSPPSDSTTR
jgi:hypothetical protein